MYLYLFIVLLLCVFIYKYDIKGNKRNRVFWERFVLVFLILIVGLRYHVGSDTVVYEWNFNTSATPNLGDFFKSDNIVTQPLWGLLMSFCKTVFGSFVAVQFFHAIVFHIFSFRFIKKTTSYTFTALLFLFVLLWFANSFEVLRESISSVIFLNALFYLKDKKYVRYILCAFLATGFHVFAFAIFLLALIVSICAKKVLIFSCVVLYFIAQMIDFSVVNQMIMNAVAFSDVLGDKVLLYVGEKDSTVISFLGVVRWLMLDLFLPIFVIIYTDKRNEFWIKFVVLWLFFSQLTSKLPILYRMDNYFQLIYIVLLVNILYNKVNRMIMSFRPVLLILSSFVLIMGLRDVYRPDMNFQTAKVPYDIRYFPYKTIFEDPDPLREAQSYYH